MNLFNPPTPQQAASRLDRYFQKVQAKGQPRPIQIRVFSQKLGLDYSFPADSTNQPYHVASIGKVFTATLVQMLAAKGAFSVKDLIHPFFSPGDLDRLFVYQDVDYACQVTIGQLLSHTSGVADYFEGGTTSSQTFLDNVLSNPQTRWTPQMLIGFTREYQKAVGTPGQVFNYSDTGYILLGLLIEKVSGKTFDRNLADEIFIPLEMHDSYLMFYGEPVRTPRQSIEKIWVNDHEVSGYLSLSCDWAGGGIISTTADLLKFNQALREGRLVTGDVLESMDLCKHKFRPGIYYGSGMMEIRFRDFFFLLGNLPRIKGHIGILATHMFYDATSDTHIILNFGSSSRMVTSFQALIEIENIIQRMVQKSVILKPAL